MNHSSRTKPEAFRFVAQCHNQMGHRLLPAYLYKNKICLSMVNNNYFVKVSYSRPVPHLYVINFFLF